MRTLCWFVGWGSRERRELAVLGSTVVRGAGAWCAASADSVERPALLLSFCKTALNLPGIPVKKAEDVLSDQFCG